MYTPRPVDALENYSRHPTKSGPGRMHIKPVRAQDHPAGTKLVARFAKISGEYRADYKVRTGREFD